MLNKAQVIGNLGSDPKVTIINNGQTKVASFSVATTERGYTTQSGVQVQEKTEWHNIVCF
ncbi:MAG: single-stranded DNA-binding protein, partial [Bacteroidales bacterium]|nr:single-stranded DNA-binding protein [Bacteroidales bacterium]